LIANITQTGASKQRNVDIQGWSSGTGEFNVPFYVFPPVPTTAATVNLTKTYSNLPSGTTVTESPAPPYSIPANGNQSAYLFVNVPSGVPPTSFNVTVQATYLNGTIYGSFEVEVVASSSVGGNVVPVDQLVLLGLLLAPYVPYVGIASAAMIAVAVATALCVKRVKHRQEKQ
jgi:hypothetical protein